MVAIGTIDVLPFAITLPLTGVNKLTGCCGIVDGLL